MVAYVVATGTYKRSSQLTLYYMYLWIIAFYHHRNFTNDTLKYIHVTETLRKDHMGEAKILRSIINKFMGKKKFQVFCFFLINPKRYLKIIKMVRYNRPF